MKNPRYTVVVIFKIDYRDYQVGTLEEKVNSINAVKEIEELIDDTVYKAYFIDKATGKKKILKAVDK